MVAIPRGRRPLPGWTPKPTWASPTGRWRLDDDEALPRVDAPRANAIDDPDAGPVDSCEERPTVDEVAVEAVMAGRHPHGLREPERVEAVRRLAAQGWSDLGIGRQIGVCDRTVLRLRQAYQIPSRWSA